VPAGYRAQFIPDSSAKVLYEIATGSVVVASASVTRAAGASTSTASLEVDAGSYGLDATAFAARTQTGATPAPGEEGAKVATASVGLVVVAGAKVPATLTLGPKFVPSVSTMSATQIYPGGSLTFGGSNLVLAWAATPSVVFTGPGASVSAVVTAVAAGSVTVTVPLAAATGSVQITTDRIKAALVTVAVAPTPTPAPTATPPSGFAAIASGSYTMGSPADEPGRSTNETQHVVTLTHRFWLQETEVTQGQWKAAFGGSNPSYFLACGDNCPVEQITWWSALAYANAMSASESLAACYTVSGCTSGTAAAGTLGNNGSCTVTVTATDQNPYLCRGTGCRRNPSGSTRTGRVRRRRSTTG